MVATGIQLMEHLKQGLGNGWLGPRVNYWEYPQYVYILITSFSYGGKKLDSEKQNDTGQLIARELKQYYIQDVNWYITARPLFSAIAIFALLFMAYTIININKVETTPFFILLEIGIILFIIFFFLVAYYSKETSLSRCRMKIYENGFVPDERNKKRKPIFIFWNQIVDIKATKALLGSPKITPNTWYYRITTQTGIKCDLSSMVFPINKRKLIFKIIEKKRMEIK